MRERGVFHGVFHICVDSAVGIFIFESLSFIHNYSMSISILCSQCTHQHVHSTHRSCQTVGKWHEMYG